ncbi:hypothetical protein [Affinirhizobium pseudoryzae]|uniref:hypothetical protein n=1 Tax=Allorhizobium pseudoryzae TaxID=379684 RepID=UPI0019D0FB00|nr:hypothetical protein [Allorhizobium pseudoryzae]
MSERETNVSAAKHARQIAHRRRPWQLLMLSNNNQPSSFSEETVAALTRILDLLPHVPGLALQTKFGEVHVSRDFSGDTTSAVDALITTVLKDDPNITGITFPGTGKRPEHTATIKDPHCLPAGKQFAAVNQAQKAGLIGSSEAIRRTKAIGNKE